MNSPRGDSLRNFAIFSSTFLLILLYYLVLPADASEPLTLANARGYAPLSVTIDGPPRITSPAKHWNGKFERWVGAGFYINWGDGVSQPNWQMAGHPQSLTNHVYTVPGNYSVKAAISHPGADDAAVTDWSAVGTVQVLANPHQSTPSARIEILSPHGDTNCFFQEYPPIKWRLSTNCPIGVLTNVLDHSGKIIDTDVIKDISYSQSSAERRFGARSWTALVTSLRKGSNKFRYQIIVSDRQTAKVLCTAYSGMFSMSNEISLSSLKLKSVSETNPCQVTIEYPVGYPPAFAYELSWGDGQVERNTSISKNIGLLKCEPQFFTHTYNNAGHYKISLLSNNTEPRKPLSDCFGIETLDITAKHQ